MKKSFLALLFCWLLFSCDVNKKVIDNDKDEDSIAVNTGNEIAIAGAYNFNSNQELNIKTAILKNVVGGKNGAYIGNKMDKLGLYFKENIEYSELQRAGEGLILELDNSNSFYFDTGKAYLNKPSKNTLNIIVNSLIANPKFNLVVEVHTDSKGSEAVNLEMTKRRGKSIGSYFIDNGIDSKRIDVVAFGENYPKEENKESQTLEANRRVIFGFYASNALKEEARRATESN